MNVLLISFSGRKSDGNCSKILDFISRYLQKRNINVSKIRMVDLDIRPCVDCEYECFNSSPKCPKDDDIYFVYESIMKSDYTIMVIPVYSAAPPALYFAWRERSQIIFQTEEIYKRYEKVKKAYIVIGNEEAGGNDVVNIIKNYHINTQKNVNILLLQSSKYGQRSIEGNLINVPQVQLDLTDFVDNLIDS
ncbi:Multimeric flavodoxin WrbA [Caloranaerobacter azorensis DSM 13643]|uniref:Multimeric flavodoxin WrbA n=1 Tax=Caloranaerobacter azorensis DSM 13643 TaxID=1121264 RepID=A0A1M5TC27_9FIRM|nr:NAD(P)H-dependent oxidoreductase [Caloranaerobacter azorensis]SHH48170.1 Multimeric flavodoxin WrbA [Caloranaerobacter azorensis DSM 13643]